MFADGDQLPIGPACGREAEAGANFSAWKRSDGDSLARVAVFAAQPARDLRPSDRQLVDVLSQHGELSAQPARAVVRPAAQHDHRCGRPPATARDRDRRRHRRRGRSVQERTAAEAAHPRRAARAGRRHRADARVPAGRRARLRRNPARHRTGRRSTSTSLARTWSNPDWRCSARRCSSERDPGRAGGQLACVVVGMPMPVARGYSPQTRDAAPPRPRAPADPVPRSLAAARPVRCAGRTARRPGLGRK